jgi:hypothetical protein
MSLGIRNIFWPQAESSFLIYGEVGRAGFEPAKAYASRFTVCSYTEET